MKTSNIKLKEESVLPFMMYSFSAEPGRARALNRLVSSCSVKGAISAGVILKTQKLHLCLFIREICLIIAKVAPQRQSVFLWN